MWNIYKEGSLLPHPAKQIYFDLPGVHHFKWNMSCYIAQNPQSDLCLQNQSFSVSFVSGSVCTKRFTFYICGSKHLTLEISALHLPVKCQQRANENKQKQGSPRRRKMWWGWSLDPMIIVSPAWICRNILASVLCETARERLEGAPHGSHWNVNYTMPKGHFIYPQATWIHNQTPL